jgi:hypothetical protein
LAPGQVQQWWQGLFVVQQVRVLLGLQLLVD